MMYVILDTNVIISALLSRKPTASVPMRIVQYIFAQKLIPVFNEEMLDEYEDVLRRQKFHFDGAMVQQVIGAIKALGMYKDALHYNGTFPDPDDKAFFEVAWNMYRETQNVYLITGNKKHFPKESFVVTPRQMLDILG